MKAFKIILIILVTLIILVGTGLFLLGYFKPKPAGINIDTNPISNVFIDGVLVGKSPYKVMRESGTITLKLVPESSNFDLLPYETKVTLVSGIETVIKREFGSSEDVSSGDVISFDKETSGITSLVVISTPDNAQVSLDGVPRGFSPYRSSSIAPGQHQISVKSPGYSDRVMTVTTISGYRLTVFAKLAKEKEQVLSVEAPVLKTYVEILNTPTGFLRVRTEPNMTGKEIAEVKPGEKYEFLEEDLTNKWFKIQYEAVKPGLPAGITGWVSAQYVKKVEEATQSGTLKP